MTRIHHYGIVQSPSTALKPLCALPAHPSLFFSFPPRKLISFLVFVFSKMSDRWNHTRCSLFRLTSCIQFSSVAQSCLTLWDPMNCSPPGLPVHHQLPEFTHNHVHWVGNAIQSSHPLSSPSPPAPNPSQHQSLFYWVNSSHEVAKYWSFSFSIIPSKEHPGLISLQSKGPSRVFSNTTVQKHQFFGAQLSSQSNSHIHTWPLEKPCD